MQDAFASNYIAKVNAPNRMNEISNALLMCGSHVIFNEDSSFTLNKVQFSAQDIEEVLHTAAALCSKEINDQVTVVDFRDTYQYTALNYGKDSEQARAVTAMINSAIQYLKSESFVFVLATDSTFYQWQKYSQEEFIAVPVRMSMSVQKTPNTGKPAAASSTGTFQITLWFTIGIVIVLLIFVVLTCGVGLDIEKDTLLYQTTCLRGQPVF